MKQSTRRHFCHSFSILKPLDEAVARDEQEGAILITTEDAIAPRENQSAVPGRRGLEQMHRAKDRYRRGNRKGSRQGDPSQDPGPEPDAGGDLGDEERVTGTGKQQFPAVNCRCEQAAFKARRDDLPDQADRGADITERDPRSK